MEQLEFDFYALDSNLNCEEVTVEEVNQYVAAGSPKGTSILVGRVAAARAVYEARIARAHQSGLGYSALVIVAQMLDELRDRQELTTKVALDALEDGAYLELEGWGEEAVNEAYAFLDQWRK